MAFDFSTLIPSIGGVSSFLSIVLWGTVIITIVSIIAVIIRNKLKYVYIGEVYRRRQDESDGEPKAKIITGKAGYFNSKGRIIFRIKYGILPWQRIELTKIPNPEYMIDNKVYYAQLQKDNYVQMKYVIDWEGTFNLEPVEDDLKYGAYLDFMQKSLILKVESTWQKYGGPITLGLILVAGIIAMYFQTKACA